MSWYQKGKTNLDFTEALTSFVGRQEEHQAGKKTEWWGAGVVICLELGVDLHMTQLMPLPLTVSCFSKIQIGFTFLVPAHSGSTGKTAIKRVCVKQKDSEWQWHQLGHMQVCTSLQTDHLTHVTSISCR